MCGICGIVGRRDSQPTKGRSTIERMSATMHHRGPDAAGIHAEDKCHVYLGHRRLAIIDLSPHGAQPIYNEDHSCVLVANGEIYNYLELREELKAKGHVFQSSTDSEVILHLFEEIGRDAFERLRGMYAVAIYDQRSRAVTLARDPLGIKPLYVYETSDCIAFASEIQAFDALPGKREPCGTGIADFLLLGAIPSPLTHQENVRAMRPGEVAVIRDGTIRYDRGTPIAKTCQEAALGANAADTARESLHDSVRRHLISDAPIGLFLSGGIDSGTIAGLARETTDADIRAACVTVPGHAMDESSYARMTARHYGISLSEIPFQQADFEAGLDHFFEHMDMPTTDGFNTYIVARAARQAGLTVALSGVGGDELFGGYPTFNWVPTFQRIGALAGMLGPLSRRAASTLLTTFNHTSGAARVAELLRHRVDRRVAHLAFRGLFVGSILKDLLHPDIRHLAREALSRYMDETAWCTEKSISSDLAVSGMEISHYMQPTLLRDTDVFSMAHSLEVRTPLVDVDVLRACLPALRPRTKTDGHPKWLLRQALNKPLPHAVVSRKKQGFSFPWQEWMQGFAMQDMERLLAASQNWDHILNADAIRRWMTEYQAGRAHWRCFWALYVLLRMLDRF